jgi:hypothetical protein
LKLRAGIVRCGACKQIFNGIEHLLPPEDAASSLAPVARASAPVTPTETAAVTPRAPDFSESHAADQTDLSSVKFTINSLDFDVPIEPQAAHQKSATISPESPPAPKADPTAAPVASTETEYHLDESPELTTSSHTMSAPAFLEDREQAASNDFPDQINQFVPTLQPLVEQDDDWSELTEVDEAGNVEIIPVDEPGFVKKWQQQQRTGRMRRILVSIASLILFVGLLAQGIYVFHKQITAWFPSMEPVFVQLCSKMGCQTNLPAQITAVSIESSELQTLAASKNTFALTLLLGNHSQVTQAWPNIELTLNDGNEQPVGRRIFMPNEYLATSPGAGIPANTEQSVKIFFELTQLKASGYRVYLFYS